VNTSRTRLLAAALIATAAASLLVAGASPAQAIVGGHDATRPYPSVAILDIDSGTGLEPACGATIVEYQGKIKKYRGKKAAVTAAHCITTFPSADGTWRTLPAANLRLRVGSSDLTGGVPVAVTAVSVAPGWDWAQLFPADTDDLGVLTVPGLPWWVPAIPITDASTPSSAITLVGLGFTTPEDVPPLAEHLQELHTRIVDPAQCADALITAGEVCVSGTRGRACDGDGGYGAFTLAHHRLAVLGASSRILAPDCASRESIYTNVGTHLGFVNEVITDTFEPAPAITHTRLTITRPPALLWQ
jgi:trypsin